MSEQIYDVDAPPTSIQDAIYKLHEKGDWKIEDKITLTVPLDKPGPHGGTVWNRDDAEEVEVTIIDSYYLDYDDKPYPRVAYWNPHTKQLITQSHDGIAATSEALLKRLQLLIP